MGSIGFPEIITILLIALLVFGPQKLPEIGRLVGKAIHELKRASSEFTESITNLDADDTDDEKKESDRS